MDHYYAAIVYGPNATRVLLQSPGGDLISDEQFATPAEADQHVLAHREYLEEYYDAELIVEPLDLNNDLEEFLEGDPGDEPPPSPSSDDCEGVEE